MTGDVVLCLGSARKARRIKIITQPRVGFTSHSLVRSASFCSREDE